MTRESGRELKKDAAGAIDRREFIAAAGAATAGLLMVRPEIALGTAANSAPQVGLLGCGGRGSSVAETFVSRAGCRVAALGNVFPDQLERAKTNFNGINAKQGPAAIDEGMLFKGPDCVGALTGSAIDDVVIGTPPYFHPLAEATPGKVKSFIENIKAGKFENQLVQGAESTLSAILGREACYRKKELVWNDVMRSNQGWKTDVDVSRLG